MHHSTARASRAGFTLVELALVLVIIGLIIGGVLAGATLIRNAEMRAIITERDKYETAINTFRLRFKALPGDMVNATGIWGAADPDPATCYTIVKSTEATCNGTGNKRIWDLADNASPIEAYEMLLIWHHLGNAGLINTNTTGAPSGPSMLGLEIGVNLPVSKIAEGSWMLMYTGSVSPGQGAVATPQAFDGEYGQTMWIGSMVDIAGIGPVPQGPLFTTAEVYGLDMKVDDGKPARGMVRTLPAQANGTGFDNNCTTTADAATAEYNTTVDGNECSLTFKLKL